MRSSVQSLRASAPVRPNAILVCGRHYIDVSLLDISLQGAIVQMREPVSLAPGLSCALRVLSAGGYQVFEAEAVIARFSEGRTVLQFGAPHEGLRRALEDFLRARPEGRLELHRSLDALCRCERTTDQGDISSTSRAISTPMPPPAMTSVG